MKLIRKSITGTISSGDLMYLQHLSNQSAHNPRGGDLNTINLAKVSNGVKDKPKPKLFSIIGKKKNERENNKSSLVAPKLEQKYEVVQQRSNPLSERLTTSGVSREKNKQVYQRGNLSVTEIVTRKTIVKNRN